MICEICCNDTKKRGFYECGHSMCLRCSARIRFILNKQNCPVCFKQNSTLIFTKTDQIIKNLKFKDFKNVFCDSLETETELTNLLENKCKLCLRTYKNVNDLINHYKSHGIHICSLCMENICVFPDEIELIDIGSVSKHNENHVYCKFCRIFLFNLDCAFSHCKKEHMNCTYCGDKKFYENYAQLEKHYKTKHFVCTFKNCKDEKTCVFEDKLELVMHLMNVHRTSMIINENKIEDNIPCMDLDECKVIRNDFFHANTYNLHECDYKSDNLIKQKMETTNLKKLQSIKLGNNQNVRKEIILDINTCTIKNEVKSIKAMDCKQHSTVSNNNTHKEANNPHMQLNSMNGLEDYILDLINDVNNYNLDFNHFIYKMEEMCDKKNVYKLIYDHLNFFRDKKSVLSVLEKYKEEIKFPKLKSDSFQTRSRK